jgi:hypothetical protein
MKRDVCWCGVEILWSTLQLHCTPPLRFVMFLKKEAVSLTGIWNFVAPTLLHCIVMAQWYEDPSLVPQSKALPIAVYNCSQKVLHVSPNWVKVGSRVQFIKIQPLTSCVSNTFCVPNVFQLRHLPNLRLLSKSWQAKETLPDLWVCESLFLGFL